MELDESQQGEGRLLKIPCTFGENTEEKAWKELQGPPGGMTTMGLVMTIWTSYLVHSCASGMVYNKEATSALGSLNCGRYETSTRPGRRASFSHLAPNSEVSLVHPQRGNGSTSDRAFSTNTPCPRSRVSQESCCWPKRTQTNGPPPLIALRAPPGRCWATWGMGQGHVGDGTRQRREAPSSLTVLVATIITATPGRLCPWGPTEPGWPSIGRGLVLGCTSDKFPGPVPLALRPAGRGLSFNRVPGLLVHTGGMGRGSVSPGWELLYEAALGRGRACFLPPAAKRLGRAGPSRCALVARDRMQ